MEHAAIQLTTGFKVSWDVDKVIQKFVDIGPPVLDDAWWTIDAEERPHWQYLPQQVAISRFFYKNFPAECKEVADQLIQLQASMQHRRNEHPLIAKFLDQTIVPTKVDIIHVLPGDNVLPHRDERKFAINIGLKNSYMRTTIFSDSEDTTEYELFEQASYSFTMQDSDVYMLQVKNVHAAYADATNESGMTRYLISYSI
jgi:hypothetical protein